MLHFLSTIGRLPTTDPREGVDLFPPTPRRLGSRGPDPEETFEEARALTAVALLAMRFAVDAPAKVA